MTPSTTTALVAEIIGRLYLVTGTSGPAELARALDLSDRSVVSNWKRRGTVPLSECLRLAKDRRVSLDWLLTGEGSMRRETPLGVAEGAHHYGEGAGMAVPVPDPPELAQVVRWLRSWWATATPEERIWLRVTLARAVPEFAAFLSSDSDGK